MILFLINILFSDIFLDKLRTLITFLLEDAYSKWILI